MTLSNLTVAERAGALRSGNAFWWFGMRRQARNGNGYRCLSGIYLPYIRKDRTITTATTRILGTRSE